MLQARIKLEIMQHSLDVYPEECCGIVTQKSRVQRYHRIDNVHAEPEKFFELDPQQYHDALEQGEMVAVCHSHTGDGATTLPSAADRCVCNEMQVPWVIVSQPEGDMRVVLPETIPLIGRPWALGSYDCWGLVMAWHAEQGVKLNDFRKTYEWWKPEFGENLYQENYLKEGFRPTGQEPQPGDMIMMQLQSPVINHAGIYLGKNSLLHHMFGKLSKVDIYSGWYQEHTVMIVRHEKLGGIHAEG